MARLNAQEYADKWSRRLVAATPDIRAGVERVSEAPGIKAAEQAERMLEGVRAAIASGKWQRKVAGVSLAEWKDKTINKGLGRIPAGVEAAIPGQIQMAGELLAAVDEVKAVVDRMPKATLEDRLLRMMAFARGMAEKQIG